MEIAKIEIMLRALELGSLTKAASEYDYSPSAISQMVSSLESELDTKLINRTYSGIEIADGMDDVVEMLEHIVKLKNQVAKTIAEKNNGKQTITIATFASISKYILPNAIKEYKKLYPYTDINIIVADELIDVYRKGVVDLMFGEPIKWGELVWEKLLTDPYVAVLPRSYECTTDNIDVGELLKSKFIMANDKNISDYIRDCTSNDSFGNNSSDDSSVIELVKAEMCVSILSKLAVHDLSEVQTKSLAPSLTRELGFVYDRNDFAEKKHVRDFVGFLGRYIRQNYR